MDVFNIQLGRASVNHSDLCLKCGGGLQFNFVGSHSRKAEVPPPWNFEVEGDFSFLVMAACKVKVPDHFKHKSGGFTLARPSCILFKTFSADISDLPKHSL